MNKVKMADPRFTESDRKWIHQEIEKILDGALSMGPNVQSFEQDFAARIGVRHAIAMNSCTSTLEAALQSKRIAGREVIIPSETFIATGMAVHLAGGIPVFAEISETTLCLDLNDVKRKITKRTSGVILVHMAGLITPDIYEFRKVCDENGIFLFEDAAHAPGAKLNGKEAGSFGHAGCFSFFPTKVITAGEGGMLTTNDDEIAEFARSFQNRGRDMKSSSEQYKMPGRNVRMPETSALIGRVQFSHLTEYVTKRQKIAAIYKKELDRTNGIKLIIPELLESSSFWKVPILLNHSMDRQLITRKMADKGISVDWAYQPALHLQPVFRRLYGFSEGHLPITEDILSRHLCLPCHPGMSDSDSIFVANSLKEIINTF